MSDRQRRTASNPAEGSGPSAQDMVGLTSNVLGGAELLDNSRVVDVLAGAEDALMGTATPVLSRVADLADVSSRVPTLGMPGNVLSVAGAAQNAFKLFTADTTEEGVQSGADLVFDLLGFAGPLGAMASGAYGITRFIDGQVGLTDAIGDGLGGNGGAAGTNLRTHTFADRFSQSPEAARLVTGQETLADYEDTGARGLSDEERSEAFGRTNLEHALFTGMTPEDVQRDGRQLRVAETYNACVSDLDAPGFMDEWDCAATAEGAHQPVDALHDQIESDTDVIEAEIEARDERMEEQRQIDREWQELAREQELERRRALGIPDTMPDDEAGIFENFLQINRGATLTGPNGELG